MTRVIAGTAGGRRLRAPAGAATRPTSDRVREALFSALESERGTLEGAAFLDVYAGSGAVGIEARSRGAARVVLVEAARPALDAIRANIATLALGEVEVLAGKADRVGRGQPPGGPFDVAFFDPPYRESDGALAGVVAAFADHGWLAAGALVVVERDRRSAWTWPDSLAPLRSRGYGETVLWYGRWDLSRSGAA